MNAVSAVPPSGLGRKPPRRRWARRVASAGLLALLMGGLLVGCSDDNPSTDVAVDESSTTVGQDATGGGQSGGGQSGAPAPVINSFDTPDSIDCHNDNSPMFTATWSTTNATKVTISIDGGGVYNTYAANGEASLPFNCSSSHTFLLTAFGEDGKTATRSVTLQPRNVQGSNEEEEE